MNAKEANMISIVAYLNHLGFEPTVVKPGYCFYYSPYRTENTPSFKVSPAKNLWVDYGDGNAGGTLIDLVLKLNPDYEVGDAIKEISQFAGQSFSFQKPKPTGQQEPKISQITITKVKPLGSNRAITDYLQERGICLDTARPFCSEVYYRIGNRHYFGLGNRNGKGWAIRNKYWKGCSGQGFSHYRIGCPQLTLFEGIFDLLSYLQMNPKEKSAADFMVLNSLANLKHALPTLKTYERVHLYLDRDNAGKKAATDLCSKLENCKDLGSTIDPYKDFNDYLMGKLATTTAKMKT
jgi:hypothetical protein